MAYQSDARSLYKRVTAKSFAGGMARLSNGFTGELLTSLAGKIKEVAAKMKLTRMIAKERYTLSCLSDHQLRDIGLTRDQVKSEFARGIFDIPSQRYYDIGFRQGGPRAPKRSGISRLPKD